MKKLEFLVGQWSGTATARPGPGGEVKMTQTEDVQWKLEGLVLLIEGTGKDPNGKTLFHALGTVAYDDAAQQYRFRAFSEGRYIDTELKLASDGRGFNWGIDMGPAQVRYVMRLTPEGEWLETGELVMGDRPPQRLVELNVKRQSSQNVK